MDEASVCLGGSVRRWVTRRKGEEYLEACMVPRFQSGRQSFMVWGAIWHGGRSQLVRFDQSASEGKRKGVTAAIYRDQITKGELKRCWNHVSSWWRGYSIPRIVEDNAAIHKSSVNPSVGLKLRFQYLDHPASSPDLNPIENCWALVKQGIAALPERPTTIEGLFEAATDLWNNIPQQHIDNMIDSIPRRLEAVREARGGAIKG